MTNPTAKTTTTKKDAPFYTIGLTNESDISSFYPEFTTLQKTIESVNNFALICKENRNGKRGPYTHEQQDLNRAMLVFACAGLDVFAKQLIENKLPILIERDKDVEAKFKDYVKTGLTKDEKSIINTLALALIDKTPRNILLKDYLNSLISGSLQSVEELRKVAAASCLNDKKLFPKDEGIKLKLAFDARNEIIHEMDINLDRSLSKTTSYRTRRKRITKEIVSHTINILRLAERIFLEYKEGFKKANIVEGVDVSEKKKQEGEG